MQEHPYRNSDYGPEGELAIMTPDQWNLEISSLRDWMDQIAGKVDSLQINGCSHRTDDIGRLDRVQKALEALELVVNDFRVEVTKQMLSIKIWVSVGALSLAVGISSYLVVFIIEHFLVKH